MPRRTAVRAAEAASDGKYELEEQMTVIDAAKFQAAAEKDFEFTREMRYFDGVIKLGMGDQTLALKFSDGKFLGVDEGAFDSAKALIYIEGSAEHWAEMLKAYPRPFYHSIQSTCVRHGMKISDSNQTFAYLPALNRMMQIMRTIHNEE
ncbi:hypothetical protein [Paraburkholderia fungorum]|uniref:hypothetical protein n=2 Tax=Paraburkholderia fungorum TaxID=134537 RepID=UPI001C1EBC02|nr:hypothetical protein [Paraburkholderia fungorum]MBU7435806.1 hypothetical protein [Paraburkholderia fungorum]